MNRVACNFPKEQRITFRSKFWEYCCLSVSGSFKKKFFVSASYIGIFLSFLSVSIINVKKKGVGMREREKILMLFHFPPTTCKVTTCLSPYTVTVRAGVNFSEKKILYMGGFSQQGQLHCHVFACVVPSLPLPTN